jgi:hypothetical protein
MLATGYRGAPGLVVSQLVFLGLSALGTVTLSQVRDRACPRASLLRSPISGVFNVATFSLLVRVGGRCCPQK